MFLYDQLYLLPAILFHQNLLLCLIGLQIRTDKISGLFGTYDARGNSVISL